MNVFLSFMSKSARKKKTFEDEQVFSKNHGRNVKFRRRIQEDKEHEQELKHFIKDKDASKTI